jgi:hypothetical protein
VDDCQGWIRRPFALTAEGMGGQRLQRTKIDREAVLGSNRAGEIPVRTRSFAHFPRDDYVQRAPFDVYGRALARENTYPVTSHVSSSLSAFQEGIDVPALPSRTVR